MMIFKKALPRRTFLRGVGTTLALPLLDSMVPAFAAATDPAAKPALRLGYVYLPVGRIMSKWTPKTEGAGFEFTPTLEPLAPFRDQLLVVSGLNIKAADPRPGEAGGNHARPCASYLTGVHSKPGGQLGISVDQVVAKEFGKHTQLASLELGLDPPEFAGGDDGAYSGYYRSTVSWRSASTPLPTEENPRKVFERMFGDSDTADPADRLRRIQRQRSILDSVTRRVARLMGAIGPSDRLKFNEYLDAVRDVERRIQIAEQATAPSEQQASGQDEGQDEGVMSRPAGVPATYAEHSKLMFDLMLLAYQTDLTRVIAFMMGWEGSNRTYREIGALDGHHSLSHHKGHTEAIAMVEQIDVYQSKQVAYFLEKMRATPDGDGSLLDHSIIICGSALGDGNLHNHNDVPILVVGSAAGQIKGGRHLRYQGLPLSNLHLATLDFMGVPDTDYIDPKQSDATGKLEGLTA
jgi:hypothetical protein